ncbi:winged helix-turn-helix domain-containing protein [Burkholderia stagnalis]|uniref:winged helix-turn-helix domain-containing protein n=1 Tax=Burkholderia stagnalis TaxID=1503054 RepID=UPI001624C262|nr:winged helix-turn-helix domain-containing protein [Burkholderia stagnalis]
MISLRNLSNPDIIGHRICELLDEEGRLTQEHLSLRLGVRRGTISKYLTALTDEGYTYIAGTISYAKPSREKGMRRGLIYLYARTAKPLPAENSDCDQLTAAELHQIMSGIIKRGKSL